MKFLMDKIVKDWLMGFLANIVFFNYKAMCVNTLAITTFLSDDLTKDLSSWNTGVFNIISTISHNFILPIAILIVTYVMVYELVTMVINSNNFHDMDISVFFRWFFKLFIAIVLLNHSFDIVSGIFEITTQLTKQILDYIQGTSLHGLDPTALTEMINNTGFKDTFVEALTEMDIGDGMSVIILLTVVSLIAALIGLIFVPIISLVVIVRYMYSYIYAAFAPITFATLGSRELGHSGKRYIHNILALAFQLVIIIIVIAIYLGSCQNVMLSAVSATGDAAEIIDTFQNAVTTNLLISIMTIFVLLKTESISKAIFS